MSSAIASRRQDNIRLQGLLVEWQTKTLANMIALSIPVAKKDQGKLGKIVESIRLWSDLEEPRPEPTPEDIVEGRAFEGRVPEGSYERALHGLIGHGFDPPR